MSAFFEELEEQLVAATPRQAQIPGVPGPSSHRQVRRFGSPTPQRRRGLGTPALAVLGLLVVVAVGGAASGTLDRWLDQGDQPPVPGISKSLAEAFPVFARPQTAADHLPAAAARRLRQEHPHGSNESLSRYVGQGGQDAWMIPAAGGVCVLLPDRALSDPNESWGMSCIPEAFVAKYGDLTAMASPRTPYQADFVALVPAGGELIVTYRDGRKVTMPAPDGVVSAHVSEATRIAVHTPAGERVDLNLTQMASPMTSGTCPDGTSAVWNEVEPGAYARACKAHK